MKIQVTFLTLAIILLTSCNSFDTVIDNRSECGKDYPERETVYITNTSKSKLLEVTIKFQNGEDLETIVRQYRPGQIEDFWVECGEKVSIVGEREITGNE